MGRQKPDLKFHFLVPVALGRGTGSDRGERERERERLSEFLSGEGEKFSSFWPLIFLSNIFSIVIKNQK